MNSNIKNLIPKKNILILFFLFPLITYSQTSTNKFIDSLKTVLKPQKSKEKVMTFIEISEKFKGINLDSATFYGVKAFDLAEKIKDDRLKIIALLQQGNLYRENSKYQKAISYFEQTLTLSKKIKDSGLIANSYSGLGIVNSRLGNFNTAINHFYNCLTIYENLKDSVNMARGYLNLAIDLRKIKEFQKSIKYNLKAMDFFVRKKDLLNVAAINNNLGGVYNENKEYLKAIKSAEKAKNYFLENNYVRYSAYPITNIGVSYDSLNKLKFAEKNYLKAIELHTKNREPYELAFLNNALANLNYKKKDYNNAIIIGNKALTFAKEVNSLEFITSSTKTLAKTFEKKNQFKQSNKYLKLHIQYKDSVMNKDKLNSIAVAETKYETEKKEKEIAQQKEQILANELAIKNRNLFAILLGAALLIVAILSLGFYKRNQFRRKQLQKEIDLKDALSTIKTQNKLQEQRLRISRDLHDNIGSQLTFIISSVDNLKYVTKDANDKLKDKLASISSFTSDTIFQLRDTIWAMNKPEISVEDLHARILSFIEKAKSATENTEFILKNDVNQDIKFTSLIGVNIFRVVQEAINNAIKYADASEVKIDISQENNQISIVIKDNGKGFDINTVSHGNGLSNMEKRMSEIDGKVFINSQEKNGTEIKIVINK